MGEQIFNMNLNEVRHDIHVGLIECNKRGLIYSAKWLAELKHGLDSSTSNFTSTVTTASKSTITPVDDTYIAKSFDIYTKGVAESERDDYDLAKTYFDVREYDRAAYFTRKCESPVPAFLHLYATYMAKEKKHLDNMTDSTNLTESSQAKGLADLLATFKSLHAQRKLDAYGLYLYGVVLKKLDLKDMAVPVFLESVHAVPTLWSSWLELAPLIVNKEQLMSLNLPNHWMKPIFIAHAHIELFLNDKGLKMFEELQMAGFKKCTYITAQTAIAYHNKRNVEKAIEIFQYLQEIDPYRLDNLDTFSNLLFVKEMKKEMASLAHKAVEINKYRPETCCVIGNYYSIRADHTKAVIYFQRALKLNPHFLSAWTLMGHEFMEMKNTNAAIQSYRKAVEVNRRDYRSWYGLGQSYEILKMPFYSLYYYKIAQQLRPYDSRMLVALGETYEKLEKYANALKCYQKACNVGDIEGITLLRLGNLYEKLGDIENAVPAYIEFCKDERTIVDKSTLCRAYITLGNYYESIGKYDDASHFAYKCLAYEDVKTEAQALLNTIKNKRNLNSAPTTSGSASSSMAARQTTTSTSNIEDNDGVEMSLDESDMNVKSIEISSMILDEGSESEQND